jgi:hypothetical protein
MAVLPAGGDTHKPGDDVRDVSDADAAARQYAEVDKEIVEKAAPRTNSNNPRQVDSGPVTSKTAAFSDQDGLNEPRFPRPNGKLADLSADRRGNQASGTLPSRGPSTAELHDAHELVRRHKSKL